MGIYFNSEIKYLIFMQTININNKEYPGLLREIFRLEKKMDVGFGGLHNSFNQLQESVDSYAKKS